MTVIGFRAWNVAESGELCALSTRSWTWTSARKTARCGALPPASALNRRQQWQAVFHVPPNPDCRCGIYAWKRPINPEFINEWSRRPPEEIAVGVVLLWGRMCGGERMTGYRAQHAEIAALVPDALARFDPERYPSVRVYRDLSTMYGDWDLEPGAGWARDAD